MEVTPTVWQRVIEIFSRAIELRGPERDDWVNAACENDDDLRRYVLRLLAADDAPRDPASAGMTAEPVSLAGALLNNRYQVKQEVGRGGFSIVYLAEDLSLHKRPVVIKVLFQQPGYSEYLDRKFRHECEALARLRHPGVVGVFDRGETADGRPFLVLDFVEGISLRSLIEQKGMEVAHAGRIVQQLGHALAAAHAKGVYHRDLKPENVIVRECGTTAELAVIIDFGIATVKDSEVAGVTTQIVGSVPYMAPEQLHGNPEARSDVYALGVIAYETLTGRRPFPDALESFDERQKGVSVKPRDLRPDISEDAEAAILKALSWRADDRFASADAFGNALAAALLVARPAAATANPGDASNRADAEAAYQEAVRLLKLGDAAAAVAEFSRAIELKPGFPVALRDRGYAWSKLGVKDNALADYDEAQRIAPDYSILVNRGWLYSQMEQEDKAIADYTEALRLKPDGALALANRGRSYLFLNQYQRAIEDYNAAIRLSPDFVRAFEERGFTHHCLRNYAQAIADYNRALALRPDSVGGLRSRAVTFKALQLFDAAIEDYSKALRLLPSHLASREERAEIYLDLKQYQLAIDDYNQVLRQKPENGLAWFNLGRSYYGSQQYKQAREAYDQAIRLNPAVHGAFFNRGGVSYALGEYERAVRDYEQSIRLNGSDPAAFFFCAETRVLLGDFEKALADYERAIQLNPHERKFYTQRAALRRRLGDHEGAESDLAKAGA